MKNIIYIRTPKCATTSGQQELVRYAKTKGLNIMHKGTGFKNEYNITSPWLQSLKNVDIFSNTHVGKNYNLNIDHVTGTDKNIKRLKSLMEVGNDNFLISSVRDPLERLVSNYFGTPNTQWDMSEEGFNKWYLSNHDKDVTHIFKGVTKVFPDFWINNFLCNYLDTNADLVGDKYDFVIIAEEFKSSMEKISTILDFPFKESNHNKTPNKPKINISDEVRELFYNNNKEDYKLYDKCRELYL